MNARPSGSPSPAPPNVTLEADPAASSTAPDSIERRSEGRIAMTWAVDCITDQTFLYASLRNISELGIFVATLDPLPIGTSLALRFAPPGTSEPFVLPGCVQWVNCVKPLADNLNPGMGVRFLDLTSDARERLVDAIHTIAYLRYDLS
jgi:type IV pilus assembly protein PilZ